jgi:hypothetical protein
MFQNLNNIFNTSKINKKNNKLNSIQHYVNSLKKTKENENTKFENLKKINEMIDSSKVEICDLSNLEDLNVVANNNRPPYELKEIFFSNNLNINGLLSNFDNLTELSKSINLENNSNKYEENISYHSMNFNIVSKDNRFNIDTTNNIGTNINLSTNTVIIPSITGIQNVNINKHTDVIINNSPQEIDYSILDKIRVVNNVYKESYKNKFVTGFGDFLRGCYFLLEFCRKYQLKYNIIILHPIQQFFLNKTNGIPNNNIEKSIEYLEYCNYSTDVNCTFNADTSSIYNEFFLYLKRQDIFNRNIFIYNICYPTNLISQENRNIIKNIIEPIDMIKKNINDILFKLNLSKKGFNVLQIRSGDQYLKKNTNILEEDFKIKLMHSVKNIIQNNNNKNIPFLLISDTPLVKNFIIRNFPNIKTFFKEITHLGENSSLNHENIKNTLIDFYLMSYSNTIYSISTYEHGSGFSRWCSVTYNIPYRCIKI